MPILVQCGGCQARMNAPDTAAGKKVKCPKCQAVLTVPSPNTGAASARSNPAPVAASKKPAAGQQKLAPALDRAAPRKSHDESPPSRSHGQDSGEAMLGELTEEQQEMVKAELKAKERLLWVGQPATKVFFFRALPYCVGGLACWVFAVVSFFMMKGEKNLPGAVGILVPLLLFVVGAVFMSAPVFAKKRAARTVYVLTHKRALVWAGGWLFGQSFEEYGPARLSGMKKQRSWVMAGAGDLVFKEEVHITTTEHRGPRGQYRGTSESVQIVQHGFMGIPNVADVEQMIKREIIDKMMKALDDD